MPLDRLPGTEGMHCAIGLYEGTRTVLKNGRRQVVNGVFGLRDPEGFFGPPVVCNEAPRFWCLYKGQSGWLACDNPAHQKDAEAVLYLTPEILAFLVWQQNPNKPLPPFLQNIKPLNPMVAACAPQLHPHVVAKAILAVGLSFLGEVIGRFEDAKPKKKKIPQNKGNKAKKRAEKLLKAKE